MSIWTAYIALGSNLGDRLANLRHAIGSLETFDSISVAACSPVYENPALLLSDESEMQPDFLNAVVKVSTTLSPLSLLEVMHEIETAAGRVRTNQAWQPRHLDLDLLLYEDLSFRSERLILPHAAIARRGFVLQPLADIDENIIIPYPVNKSAAEALEHCNDESRLTLVRDVLC